MTTDAFDKNDGSPNLAEEEARLNELIRIEDDYIVFPKITNYDVALSQLDSERMILQWTYHLTEKSWMTREILRRFVRLAADYHKISLQPI